MFAPLRNIIMACLVALVLPGAAYARDLNIITYSTTVTPLWQLVSSAPADNSLQNGAPPAVTMTFSQNIDPAKSGFTVYDPYNDVVSGVGVAVKDFSMSAPLPAKLAVGLYRVEWHAGCLCAGTNTSLQGTLRFTVQ